MEDATFPRKRKLRKLGKQKKEKWFSKQHRHERKRDSGRKMAQKVFLQVSDWLKLLEGKKFFHLFVCLFEKFKCTLKNRFFVLILCTKMSTFLILLIKSKSYGKMM